MIIDWTALLGKLIDTAPVWVPAVILALRTNLASFTKPAKQKHPRTRRLPLPPKDAQ